jgi:type IV pilus assembly protein PilB
VELETGGKSLDLRVSVLPTAYGEKVVIRVLDRSSFLMSQKQLGLIEGKRGAVQPADEGFPTA